jgi:predicted acetyltransferase
MFAAERLVSRARPPPLAPRVRHFPLTGSRMQLFWPAAEYLESYVQALRRGWSPNTTRPEAGLEELAQIEEDPALFLASQVDREAQGPPVVLPDGSAVPRLPGYRRWMWDGEFCGVIGFRWQPGTSALPPYCLGHIGYSVVPWKQRRGYATQALRMLLNGLDEEGLTYVELTTEESNPASIRVIEANGGVLVERFTEPAAYGGGEGLRYRIDLLPPRR